MKLRLYVDDTNDDTAWEAALGVCSYIEGCELVRIDVNERPDLAANDAVLSTPTLVCDGAVKRRIVGDFSNPKAAATYLTLPEW